MAEWLHSLRLRLRAARRRTTFDRDLQDEMAFHLAEREAQLRDAGTAHPAAGARRQFGSTARIREELRDAWAIAPRMSGLLQDVRYAARTLRRHRGFATVVVLTLAFGIGINTATFSVVNAALLRPLPFADSDRLVALRERLAGFDFDGGPFSPPDFLDLQREQRSFAALAAYQREPVELSGAGDPIRVDAARVSANLFSMLGVSPLLGRGFTPEDDRPGVHLAVLSWGLWQARFGGDPSVIGQLVRLDRRPYTVVGVMPASFEFPQRGASANDRPAALWITLAFTEGQRQARGSLFVFSAIGRLADDVSVEQASADLERIAAHINDEYPPVLQEAGFVIGLSAIPLRDAVAGPVERPLLLLFAAVGLVLLVTCANVANLVLGRVASRTRELSLRTALGSSWLRLLRLLFAEAALLAMAGGLLGVLLARLIVGAIPPAITDAVPALRDVPIDLRVLAFTAGVAIATALVCALMPLVVMDRRTTDAALREDAPRATPGRRRHRLQAGLVVSTVALACVLLVGAGLFTRSFAALMAVEPGFDPDRLITASLTLPPGGYGTAASVRAFHDELLTRVSSLPGVESAALMTDLPFEWYERRTVAVEHGPPTTTDGPPRTNVSWVHGPTFETLRIPVVHGRGFSAFEHAGPRWVVIVNERLAQRFWPGGDAVGRRIRWGLDVAENPNRWLTVVGVVADVADGPPGTDPYMHAYEPFSQFPDIVWDTVPTLFGRHLRVAVRAEGDPRALARAVRTAIREMDPQLAVESIATMHDRLADVVAPRRVSGMALNAFSAGALLLAAMGLYGLLAFTVVERRREIAVRLALGAEPAAILRMVARRGLALAAIGLAIGLVVAFGAARAVGSLVYETRSHDPLTFALVPVVLVSAAVLACAVPARRASRVEPLIALRGE
jgi:predicted permease